MSRLIRRLSHFPNFGMMPIAPIQTEPRTLSASLETAHIGAQASEVGVE